MFYREKAYTRINWKNRPNLSTPLGAKNLNKMDETINELDNRIIEISSEVEKDRLNISLVSGELNALKEDVEENTLQIKEISSLAEDVNGLKIVNTASGTTAYMDDASNMGLEGIDFFGESKQETTTGKNLLKFSQGSTTSNGITFTVNADKSVTVNGTATADAVLLLTTSTRGDIDLDSLTGKNIILSGCPSGGSGTTYKFQFWSDSKMAVDTGNGATLDLSTVPDTWNFAISIISGTTVNNLTFYPMIRLSSITDATYEPYTNGPAPNPDYPQMIESTVVNRIDVMRKNLLQNTANDIERIGLTYTMQSDGSVKVVGTTTEANYQVLIGQVTLPKGSYILSGAPNSICRLRIAKGDNSTLLGHDLGSGFSFTLEEESTVFVSVRTQSTVGTNINVVYYPMIRPSFFTDGTYEPYESQTVNLSAPIELNGFGGVRDTDKLKKFGVVVFDGSDDELWSITDTSNTDAKRVMTKVLADKIVIPIDNSTMINIMCTQLINRTANQTYTMHDGISVQGKGFLEGYLVVYSANFNTSDISLWKAHLQANPMTVVYELAEPIETELPIVDQTAIKQRHTYKPNTVVMNDADAEMDVHYVADPRLYIDKKFEALASAIVNQ